jgi:Fe-S-cluster-containing dehydrogenase component
MKDRDKEPDMNRRNFVNKLLKLGVTASCLPLLSALPTRLVEAAHTEGESGTQFGMGINVKACIGCGKCVVACKNENNVVKEPFYFRTWVERYILLIDGETIVDSPNGGADGFKPVDISEIKMLRCFFVPKLCNQCENPPCVQV